MSNTEKLAIELYERGYSMFQVALELDKSQSWVWRVLRKYGVKTRPARRWDCKEYLDKFAVFRLVLRLRPNLSEAEVRLILKRHIENPSTLSKYTKLFLSSEIEIESQLSRVVQRLNCSKLTKFYLKHIKPVLEIQKCQDSK